MPTGIIYFYEDDYMALKRLARQKNVSFSEYAREVLLEHMRSIGEAPEQKDQKWRFRNYETEVV